MKRAGQKKRAAGKAALLIAVLSFPPEPLAVPLAPVRVALLVPADQNTKANAGSAVTLLAKLVEADHFRLRSVLSMGW